MPEVVDKRRAVLLEGLKTSALSVKSLTFKCSTKGRIATVTAPLA
jgi:hypothetical protein